MPIGVPTAKTTRPRRLAPRTPANLRTPPLRTMRGARTRLPRSGAVVSREAVRRRATAEAAKRLAPMLRAYLRALSPLAPFLLSEPAQDFIWNEVTAPKNFPGWGNINPSYTREHDDANHNIVISPGQKAPNGFSHGSYSPGILRDGLLDLSDGSAISGYRYWGHFHALPAAPHTLEPKPNAEDWPSATRVVPGTAPQVNPARSPNLAQLLNPFPFPNTFTLVIPANGKPALKAQAVSARPPQHVLEGKASVHRAVAIMVGVANAGGGLVEFLDIMAEASEYHPDSMMRSPGLSPLAAKAEYLFLQGGLNHIDGDLLFELLIENEVEDRIYGTVGRMSAKGSRQLRITYGAQTGLVL